jgi:hypothetical protein
LGIGYLGVGADGCPPDEIWKQLKVTVTCTIPYSKYVFAGRFTFVTYSSRKWQLPQEKSMGKGRSDKPAVEQYLEDIEWQNDRRNSPKGYLGKWYNPAYWKVRHSQREIFFVWTTIIGAILYFGYVLFTNYDYTILPLIILPSIAGIIIFFAILDGTKRK